MTANDEIYNTPLKTLAQKLAGYADILRDCSATGLHFAANIYERDRWKRVQDVTVAV